MKNYKKLFKISPSTDEKNVYTIMYRENIFRQYKEVATAVITPGLGYHIMPGDHINSESLSYLKNKLCELAGISKSSVVRVDSLP